MKHTRSRQIPKAGLRKRVGRRVEVEAFVKACAEKSRAESTRWGLANDLLDALVPRVDADCEGSRFSVFFPLQGCGYLMVSRGLVVHGIDPDREEFKALPAWLRKLGHVGDYAMLRDRWTWGRGAVELVKAMPPMAVPFFNVLSLRIPPTDVSDRLGLDALGIPECLLALARLGHNELKFRICLLELRPPYCWGQGLRKVRRAFPGDLFDRFFEVHRRWFPPGNAGDMRTSSEPRERRAFALMRRLGIIDLGADVDYRRRLPWTLRQKEAD